jgi:hypothetical protein
MTLIVSNNRTLLILDRRGYDLQHVLQKNSYTITNAFLFENQY